MIVDTETLLAEVRRLVTELAAGRGNPATAAALAGKVLALTAAIEHLYGRLDQILALVTEMTALNFDRKLEVREDDDWLVSGVVIGLNMMGDELRRRAEELTEARDRALAASRAKSAFLANMSHELRTPLNAIIGYSELLREECQGLLDDHLLGDLDKIVGAGRHLLALIKDTLDLSKIEAGKLELSVEVFPIDPLIDELIGTARPLVAERDNRLVVERAPGLGEMRSDRTKLLQSLLNLLSNATKFTTLGTIRFAASRTPDEVTFTVEDTGIGIHRDKLDVIFGAFNQADEEITRRFGGSGLGLTITRHFCQMMGGDISVTSEIGSGSTFTLRLPARHEFAPELSSTALDPRPAPRAAALVISEDPALVEVILQLTAGFGAPALHFTSGAAALQVAAALSLALIIIDDRIREYELLPTLVALRDDPELSRIPRVVLGEVPSQARGEVSLPRPLRRELLLAALGQHLRVPPLGDLLVVLGRSARREILDRALAGRRWRVHDAPDPSAVSEALQRGVDAVLLELALPQAAEIAASVRSRVPAPPLIGLGERRDAGAEVCTAVLPPHGLGALTLLLETLAFEGLGGGTR